MWGANQLIGRFCVRGQLFHQQKTAVIYSRSIYLSIYVSIKKQRTDSIKLKTSDNDSSQHLISSSLSLCVKPDLTDTCPH